MWCVIDWLGWQRAFKSLVIEVSGQVSLHAFSSIETNSKPVSNFPSPVLTWSHSCFGLMLADRSLSWFAQALWNALSFWHLTLQINKRSRTFADQTMQILLHRKGQTSKEPKLAIAQGEQAWGQGHGGQDGQHLVFQEVCWTVSMYMLCICVADVHFWILNGFAFDTALSCFVFWNLKCFCACFHWSPATGARARGGNWGRWVSVST